MTISILKICLLHWHSQSSEVKMPSKGTETVPILTLVFLSDATNCGISIKNSQLKTVIDFLLIISSATTFGYVCFYLNFNLLGIKPSSLCINILSLVKKSVLNWTSNMSDSFKPNCTRINIVISTLKNQEVSCLVLALSIQKVWQYTGLLL